MEELKLINFEDVTPEEVKDFRVRQAARAIVFDQDDKIGLLQVNKYNYHKLPGGGVEDGEDLSIALARECLEEIGCQVAVIVELGAVTEYRKKFLVNQKSFCYIAKVVGEKGEPNFTQKEINEEFSIVWVSLDEAIKLLEDDHPSNYEGKFIQIRDLVFLKKYQEIKS